MEITDPLTRRLHIKMSGCPNGCSQHHIANIGFYGASIKVGEHTIPAYVAHIGGNYEGGEIVYGKRLKVRLPAKRVPEAVERWIRLYEAERNDGEEFNAFADRVGTHGVRGRGPRPRAAGRVRPRDDGACSSTGTARSPSRSSGARASARSDRAPLAKAAEHEQLVFLCSFQKEESVILDELLALAPHTRVVTIDTGVLFPETLADVARLRGALRRAGRGRGRLEPGPAVDRARALLLDAKVAALERALDGRDAWITGIRREQAATRAARESSSSTRSAAIWKYNPLADWTEKDVWRRIHERDLPYHPLHDQGYASIGCAPCTQPGSGREGRWAGTDKTECGLHVAAVTPDGSRSSSSSASGSES